MLRVDKIRDKVSSLIKEYGNEITIIRPISKEYDTSAGREVIVYDEPLIISCVVENFSFQEITGSIKEGDIRITISSDYNINILDDILIYDGSNYNIVNIMRNTLKNEIISQEIQARK